MTGTARPASPVAPPGRVKRPSHARAIRLKRILTQHHILPSALAKGITQRSGKPLSKSAMSLMLARGVMPARTPPADIKAQVEAHLRAAGVPEADIAQAWEPDASVDEANPIPPSRVDASLRAHRISVVRVVPATARPSSPAAQPTHPAALIPPVEPDMLTQDAKRHFKLFRDPFQHDVQTGDDVYINPDIRYVRESAFNAAKLGGMLAVVGESGAGKSVLRRDLIDRIQREGHPVRIVQPRVIDKGTLTAGQICEAILDDLRPGVPVPASLERRARLVERLLTESARLQNAHVLLIEEAHDLRVQTLKFLKRFWELEDGFRKLLSIILVGQPELKVKLDERQSWEAREVIRRIEIAELPPLDKHLREYLDFKIRRSSPDRSIDDIFDASGIDAIRTRLTHWDGRRTLSMLYPLSINNLATRAINAAAANGVPRVDGAIVAEI
jgi:type II secretory pathway predicted ATPase ExeA